MVGGSFCYFWKGFQILMRNSHHPTLPQIQRNPGALFHQNVGIVKYNPSPLLAQLLHSWAKFGEKRRRGSREKSLHYYRELFIRKMSFHFNYTRNHRIHFSKNVSLPNRRQKRNLFFLAPDWIIFGDCRDEEVNWGDGNLLFIAKSISSPNDNAPPPGESLLWLHGYHQKFFSLDFFLSQGSKRGWIYPRWVLPIKFFVTNIISSQKSIFKFLVS